MAGTGAKKNVAKKIDSKKQVAPKRLKPVVEKTKAISDGKNKKISWTCYLYKVLKDVHPTDLGISKKSVIVMNDMMDHIFHLIANEASTLCYLHRKGNAKKQTLMMRDVQCAVRLLLPGDLARYAGAEAMKAMHMYTESYHQKK